MTSADFGTPIANDTEKWAKVIAIALPVIDSARVDRLLDVAQPHVDARYVRFISVTGYRWSLPIAEARSALLATQVGGDPLSHEHGAPVRLVAPGRRGFQWVKWVVRLEVRTAPDPGELVAIHTSSFTPAGRGEGE